MKRSQEIGEVKTRVSDGITETKTVGGMIGEIVTGQQRTIKKVKDIEDAILNGKGKEEIQIERKEEVKTEYKNWMKDLKKKK